MNILPGPSRLDFPAVLNERGCVMGAEIGVEHGEHAAHLLNNWPGTLLLVDTWKDERCYYETKQRLRAYAERFVAYRVSSVRTAELIPDASLDFVYIDADHRKDAVAADLRAWHPKVRPGGIIAGHDFGNREALEDGAERLGVREAVEEFVAGADVTVHVAHDEGEAGTWYFVKG